MGAMSYGKIRSVQLAPQPTFPVVFSPSTNHILWELGDSITFGTNASNGNTGGYRKPLQDWITANSYDITTIGTSSGPFGNNDGHSGFTIEQLQVEATAVYPGHLQPADLVIVIAGTNNCNVGYNGPTAQANYTDLIQYIASVNPAGCILVTTIPPIDPADTIRYAAELDLNSRLPAAWDEIDAARAPGSPVLLRANMLAALGGSWSATYFNPMNVHPKDAGYAVMEDELERVFGISNGLIGP